MLGSEVENPQRTFPLALIAGVTAIIGVYLLTNLAYFSVLNAGEVASSDRVAADMLRRIAGPHGAAAVSVAAMISIFAALNGSILSGSRVPYAMARDGYFFRHIGRVDPVFRTPSNSILLLGVWSSLFVLSGHYSDLYNAVIFPSWILYGMTAAAVIVLRRKRPDLARPYRTWGYPWVPLAFVGVTILLLYQTLISSPRASGIGLVVIVLGVPFFFYWKRRRGDSKAVVEKRVKYVKFCTNCESRYSLHAEVLKVKETFRYTFKRTCGTKRNIVPQRRDWPTFLPGPSRCGCSRSCMIGDRV